MVNIKPKRIYGLLESTSSIKSRIIISYAVITFLMLIPLGMVSYNSIGLSRQYNKIIYNVNYATTLNKKIKSDVGNLAWDIMAGKTTFEKSNPYKVIDEINNSLEFLRQNASSVENKRTMEIALRTMKTLSMYVDKLKQQINDNAPVDQNEQIVEEIRRVTSTLYEFEQDFIMMEIVNASFVNESIQSTQNLFFIAAILSLMLVVVFAFVTISSLMEAIRQPILKLENFAETVAQGNFYEKVELPKVKELTGLTSSLNTMSIKLEKLIHDSIEDEQNLKKAEIKTLQAQITPHFLYNTLDTIVWLAEDKKFKEVIDITRAFSMYFRISLSKGDDWIPISKEISHAKNYLTIQKIRYRDILNYTIEADEDIMDKMILKLLLQPLIENAIYHGVKRKRETGHVLVRVKKNENFIRFEITDTGKGMLDSEIEEVYKNLLNPPNDKEGGYGLYNVNQRLILYYGEMCSLKIKSKLNIGTTVYFDIPKGV